MKREDFVGVKAQERADALRLAMEDKSNAGGGVSLVEGKFYGLATLEEAMQGLGAKPMPLDVPGARSPRYWVIPFQDGDDFIGVPFSYATGGVRGVDKDSKLPKKSPNWDANGQPNPNDMVDVLYPGGAIAECLRALRGRFIHEMSCGLAEWCKNHGVIGTVPIKAQHLHRLDFNDRTRTQERDVYYLAAVNAQGQVVPWDGQVPDTAKYINGMSQGSQPVQQPVIQQQPAGPVFGQPVGGQMPPQGPVFGQ